MGYEYGGFLDSFIFFPNPKNNSCVFKGRRQFQSTVEHDCWHKKTQELNTPAAAAAALHLLTNNVWRPILYRNQYSSPSHKQKQQLIYALVMEWNLLVWSRNGLGRRNSCVFCVLTYSRTWIIHHLGWGWVGERPCLWTPLIWRQECEPNGMVGFFFFKYFVLNEYLSESIVWFKSTSFVKNIWKFLIRHKCKVISFSHCKGNKNLMIIELYLI